jgi:hypothetical protein
MVNCIVCPIQIVESRMHKSVMTCRMNFGQIIRSIGYVPYIGGSKEKILVNAGGSAHYLSGVRGLPSTGIQKLETDLRKIGSNFYDIDMIILTLP